MSQLSNYIPPTLLGDSPPPPKAPNILDLGADAVNSEWIGAWALRQVGKSSYEPDPNYDPFAGKGDQWKLLTSGLDISLHPAFDDAVSFDHAMKIREQMLSVQASRNELAGAGWTGKALQVGAGIFDPVMVASAFIPGGGEVAAGSKAARLAYLFRSGLAVGGPMMAAEAYRQSQDPQATTAGTISAGLGGFGLGSANAFSRAAGFGVGRRALTGAFGQAVGPAAVQSVQAAQGQITPRDVMYGIVLNGAFGAFFGAAHVKDVENIRRAMELEDIKSVGGEVTPHGQAEYKGVELPKVEIPPEVAASPVVEPAFAPGEQMPEPPQPAEAPVVNVPRGTSETVASAGSPAPQDPEVQALADKNPGSDVQRQPDGTIHVTDPDTGETTVHPFVPPQQSGAVPFNPSGAGAATPFSVLYGSDGPLRIQRLPGDPEIRPTADAPIAAGKARVGMLALGARDGNPADIRWAFRAIFADPLAAADKGGQNSVEEITRNIRTKYWTRATRELQPDFESWYKENRKDYGFMGRAQAENDFGVEVSKAVRREPGTYTDSAFINSAADKIRALNYDMWEFPNRMGVPGYEAFRDKPTYLTRAYMLSKINQAIKDHGKAEVDRLFGEAILNKQPSLDPETAGKLGKGMLDTIINAKSGIGIDKARMFSADKSGDVAIQLRENIPGITNEEIDNIISAIIKKPDAGKIARAMYRTDLDETHSIVTSAGTLAFEDLLDNNVYNVTHSYIRQMAGAASTAELLRAYSIRTQKSIKTLDAMMTDIKDLTQVPGNDRANKAINDKLAVAQEMVKQIQGFYPDGQYDHGSTFASVLSTIRSVNFIVSGGTMPLAHLSNFGRLLGRAGFDAIWRTVPAIPDLVKSAITGNVTSEEMRAVESVLGLGTEAMQHSVVSRFDPSAPEPLTPGTVAYKTREWANIAGKVTGFQYLSRFMQLWAGAAAEQKWIGMANAGERFTPIRLGQMNIEPAMQERIMGELKKNVSTVKSPTGRDTFLSNIDQWDDQEAASALVSGMDKWSRSVIQSNDLGQMMHWMTKPVGQTIMQFRTFHMASWEKQTLVELQAHDKEAAATFMLQMLGGAVSYIALRQFLASGKSDREEILKKELTPRKIGMAAFGRSGLASFLPEAYDATIGRATGAPQFGGISTTGREPFRPWMNPTLQMGDRISSAIPGIIRPMLDSSVQYDQGNFRNDSQLLPFNRAWGIRQGLNAIERFFPKSPKQYQ